MAFVLGGGGARGALQVGALRALLEAGYKPDLLVGTSIGAVNAAYLALHGLRLSSVDGLEAAWHVAAAADLLPSNYLWLTVRALFYREGPSLHRMREFIIGQGLSPEMRFGDIRGVRLIAVAVDLNSGRVVPFGADPRQSVLEGVLASTALPPWVRPLHIDGQWLMDGGAVCNLPIEVALGQGAGEIIALDLSDPRRDDAGGQGFGPFLQKLLLTVEQRQTELELALAAARRVRVRRICLCGERLVPLWDFQHTDELIAYGYAVTCQAIGAWDKERRPDWFHRLTSIWKTRWGRRTERPLH
jgi:NTE family protein